MKRLFVLIGVVAFVCLLWVMSGFWRFDKKNYLNNKVLDMASPINGSIDTELFKSLVPAYEQQ